MSQRSALQASTRICPSQPGHCLSTKTECLSCTFLSRCTKPTTSPSSQQPLSLLCCALLLFACLLLYYSQLSWGGGGVVVHRTHHLPVLLLLLSSSLCVLFGLCRSKERLLFSTGVRRFYAEPIFSSHTSGNKHKFERFLQPGAVAIATVIAPIIFPPMPVLCFKYVSV